MLWALCSDTASHPPQERAAAQHADGTSHTVSSVERYMQLVRQQGGDVSDVSDEGGKEEDQEGGVEDDEESSLL